MFLLHFKVSCTRKFLIKQHVETALHQDKVNKLNSGNGSQSLLPENFKNMEKKTAEQEFSKELCEAFLSANIPLSKVRNTKLKRFLEKYSHHHVPDESTLRKNYVDEIYTEVKTEIRSLIGNHLIYFEVDETTDSCGRYIANLLIGCLSVEKAGKSYLISSKQLDKTNNCTITRFVHEGITNFFLPNPIPHDKVILMLSDAAPYMCKASVNLKIFFPNLIHTTCLAHGINRVAEEIRNQFPLVNELISNVKKFFLKAPLRIQLYKESFPGLPLPPQPVITRWGTWLNAAIFYSKNYEKFKNLILEFSDESNAIKEAKKSFKNCVIPNQLAFIASNFSVVAETILKLESKELLLTESVNLINKCHKELSAVKGTGGLIFKKLNSVLDKNEGFKILSKVSKILNGEIIDDLELDPYILSNLKYAPITSVDVERSFSTLKHLLDDRRHSFKTENLEKHLIVNFFNNNK